MKKQSEPSSAPEASAKRVARLETVRIWFLLAATVLLIGGYALNRWIVLAASVLPLAAVGLITLRIKRLEGESKDE